MTITTTAAVVESAGTEFTFTDVVLSDPHADEVVVDLVATGLCHTDLTVRAGHLPFPLPGIVGHEGAGIVREIGNLVTHVKPGDKVLLGFTSCGNCEVCRSGHPAYCNTWFDLNMTADTRPDGSYRATRVDGRGISSSFFGQSSLARTTIASARSVVRLADEITDADLRVLAPLGCGVQTGFGTVWNVLKPIQGDSIAIFGAGAVGLSAVMAANLLPLDKIIAIDRVPSRLALAKELGATHTIDATERNARDEILELTGGVGLEFSVETTGNTTVLRQAFESLRPRGATAVVGSPPYGAEASFLVSDFLLGKRMLGVTMGDAETQTLLPFLADLHSRGKLPLEKLVNFYDFADLNKAAHDMHGGVTVKPVIQF
jgi:aryl-alcohol dehydrogenase